VRPDTERARLDALRTPLLAQAATPYVALSGAANVVMQLSWPQVGYAVKDSPVEEAALFNHPRRRQRTTVGFLAVAVHGTAAERAAYRRAVNGSHARVRSAPGAEPAYHAFDPELQRWVASCIYRGFEDAYEAVHGPLGPLAEEFYRQGLVFGTTLQMPAELWPSDRAAFEDYWREALGSVAIDEPVRDYLTRVIRMEYLGDRVARRVARPRTWVTTGFLPEPFREPMGLTWSAADQQRFDRFTRRVGTVIRRAPARVRTAPFGSAIRDVRRRLAEGTPLF
jgi:uncharacterized protein (DUF2236 family)